MKLDYIYFHVGRISVNWADAEEAIDGCLRLFARANPDPLYQIPISTKRRIEVFKRQLKVLNLDDEVRTKGKEIIARFKHLAWHRHWTTHGTIETPSFMGQTWRSYRGFVSFLKENISTRELESLDLHLSDLEEMGDEALRLFSDIVHWKAYDLGCETPKKTEKVLRKISVRLP